MTIKQRPKPIRDPDFATRPSLLISLRDDADENAWMTFESVYGPIIRSYCRRRGIQESDIDDITQEVVVAVSKSIASFDYCPDRGKFRSWLATITANKLKTFVAKQSRYQHLVKAAEQFVARPDSDQDWSSIYLQKLFETVCERVEPHFAPATWESFRLTWIEHQAASDVATALQITISRVYLSKSRVLKRMEQEFRSLSDDLPRPA